MMLLGILKAVRALLLAGLLLSPAYAEPLAIEHFFRMPQMIKPLMSPSGHHIAALMADPITNRLKLVVMDAGDLSKSRVIAGFSDADISEVNWVNDDRLVFSLQDSQSAYLQQKGSGLYARDREGKEPIRRLIKRAWESSGGTRTVIDHELSIWHRFFSTLSDGSNDVIVARYAINGAFEVTSVALLRLDTRTGHSELLTKDAPKGAMDWVLDAAAQPRVVRTQIEGKASLYWKPKDEWVLLQQGELFGEGSLSFEPLFLDKNNILYAQAHMDASADSTSLVKFDLNKKGLKPESVLSLQGYDFTGELLPDKQRQSLLGVHFTSDAKDSLWFDPRLKAWQEQINAALPGMINLLDCGACQAPGQVLVSSYSDQQPAVYRLFNTKTGEFTRISASRGWIKPASMAKQEVKQFAARDGLTIPVAVTRLPSQTGPAPMVVLVHGGPYLRGSEWEWDSQVQFLASRGYVVIEPEFRGSTGFGLTHFKAGWKQWGLKMQDDIADATRWAIEQGYADPQRVCIAGASYGGYATLMGLIRYPELYRCGVSWVGVTDIHLMYSIRQSDLGSAWKKYGMPKLVGDPVADVQQLEQTSPLKQAKKLTQPLLLAYGGEDRRVPYEHGALLRKALEPHNPNVEWILYGDEGHGWTRRSNQLDFWKKVEKFLDKNLKQ
jgi:dienelactone hydrolase